jgi:uncharacterized pyridoxamine 5'-phosphate oxidase family protein
MSDQEFDEPIEELKEILILTKSLKKVYIKAQNELSHLKPISNNPDLMTQIERANFKVIDLIDKEIMKDEDLLEEMITGEPSLTNIDLG